jgi:hypothetical protein
VPETNCQWHVYMSAAFSPTSDTCTFMIKKSRFILAIAQSSVTILIFPSDPRCGRRHVAPAPRRRPFALSHDDATNIPVLRTNSSSISDAAAFFFVIVALDFRRHHLLGSISHQTLPYCPSSRLTGAVSWECLQIDGCVVAMAIFERFL